MYENVKKSPTEIYGLKYRPSLEPEYSDDVDKIQEFFKLKKRLGRGITVQEADLFRKEFLKIKDNCKCILEIGVAWKAGESFAISRNTTKILLEEKNPNTLYLGVDLGNRTFINNPDKNIYTIQTDSRNREMVMNFLRKKGIFEIDFLFIDGFHSVNITVNDWQYSEYLSKNGIIGLHDIAVHPGSYVVFDAINEQLFHKKKYFEKDIESMGIAIMKRKLTAAGYKAHSLY